MKKHTSVEKLKEYCVNKSIKVNPFLIEDIENNTIEVSVIPTSKVSLGILMAAYKTWVSTEDLKAISNQSAKPCQMLRDLGFQFQKDKKQNNELSTHYLCYQDGVEGRKIIDYYKNHSADQGKIKLSAKEKKVFLLKEVDYLTGRKDKLQIDHRCPTQAIIKAGIRYPDLNTELVSKGLDKKYYQGLTSNSNTQKKSVCQNCLNGHDIKLPPVGETLVKAGYVYKKNFEDHLVENQKNQEEYQQLPCFGCFYFNHEEPLKIIK